MKTVQWTGVYPAVTTKFTSTGELDLPAFLSNIEYQISVGIDGVIIGGSLGESSTLSPEERLELLTATLERFGEQTDVILNIAEGSTRNAVKLAQAAEACGAHGLLLLPPFIYKPTDQEVDVFL
jgi:4-hydroxy-tetrahydrodipicolinate synthase